MAEANQAEMLRYWVWLSLVFGAGSVKVLSCLQHFDTPKDVYDALQAGMVPNLPEQIKRGMAAHSIAEADSIVYYCRSHDITLIPMDSEQYPAILLAIPAPPILLTAAGDLKLLQNPLSLAVVGTRNPSPYTVAVTNAMVTELCRNSFVIVSGFAKGVDSVAHTAALDAGASTIAVLGCGINVNYPRENHALRERMLSSGNGLFLSEYMPGVQPFPSNFPKRNRILSGLGYGTAVMEAAARSGSLVTAQCAIDQGRYLFCVPPADLFDPRYAGVIPLLRDGAIPLMSHRDLLLAYYEQYPQYLVLQEYGVKPSERMVFADSDAVPEIVAAKAQPDTSAEQEEAPDTQPKSVPGDANLPDTEEGRSIVRYLREHGDTYADDIAFALDMDLSQLLSTLMLLELDGYVESLFGKQYRAV